MKIKAWVFVREAKWWDLQILPELHLSVKRWDGIMITLRWLRFGFYVAWGLK